MTDLEITKLCAEAMGVKIAHEQYGDCYFIYHPLSEEIPLFHKFDPLHNDAQAMALVKKLQLNIIATLDLKNRIVRRDFADGWAVESSPLGCVYRIHSKDLNRAICECVARMQEARSASKS